MKTDEVMIGSTRFVHEDVVKDKDELISGLRASVEELTLEVQKWKNYVEDVRQYYRGLR
jgi:hypothetical protein